MIRYTLVKADSFYQLRALDQDPFSVLKKSRETLT